MTSEHTSEILTEKLILYPFVCLIFVYEFCPAFCSEGELARMKELEKSLGTSEEERNTLTVEKKKLEEEITKLMVWSKYKVYPLLYFLIGGRKIMYSGFRFNKKLLLTFNN